MEENNQVNVQPTDQGNTVQPVQSTPAPQPESTMPTEGSTTSSGPFIGIIIIVLVLIVGGLYFWWTQTPSYQEVQITPAEIETAADPTLEALNTQSTSDAVSDIEADLNDTTLDDLDAELGDIDLEFSI